MNHLKIGCLMLSLVFISLIIVPVLGLGAQVDTKNTYTITATAGPNGNIAPPGEVIVEHGTDQPFSFTPDLGYHISDVVVDTISIGSPSSHTFVGVTDDHSIEVSFAIMSPLLIIPSSGTIVSQSERAHDEGYSNDANLLLAFNMKNISTVMNDWSMYSNTGTVYGATSTVSYYGYGAALKFDEDRIAVSDSDSLDNITDQFAVMTWIKPNRNYDAEPNQWFDFVHRSGEGGGVQFDFGYQGWNDVISFKVYNGSDTGFEAKWVTTLTEDYWTHVAGVLYSNNTMALIVNGTVKATTTFIGTIKDGDTLGIASTYGGANYWNGTLDDVRIFNVEKSVSEIVELKGRPIRELVLGLTMGNTVGSVLDSSNYGHDGVVMGGATDTAGYYYRALDFDGENDRVQVTQTEVLNITDSLTIEFWFKQDIVDEKMYLLSKGHWGDKRGYRVQIKEYNVIQVDLGNTTHLVYYKTNTDFDTAGIWHHFAFSYNATDEGGVIYIDGEEDFYVWGDPIADIAECKKNLDIASHYADEYFGGILDEVRIYSTALTQAQVQEDMSNPAGAR